jgi:anti-sigma regulatory factor (Ser/Thr protein kinase)
MAGSPDAAGANFRHEAFFYADQEDFVAATAAFVRDGLEAGEPVLAVLRAPKIDGLRSELGDTADGVLFADMGEVGMNPARIIPAWSEFVTRNLEPGGRARGIGEPVSCERSAAELVECQRHESLLNLAFADVDGFHLLCAYDVATLGPDVLVEARRSHPFLCGTGADGANEDYLGVAELGRPFADPLPQAPVNAGLFVFDADRIAAARRFAALEAIDAGLCQRAAEDLVLAVDEVVTNSVVHGGGGGMLRVWCEDDMLLCDVRDEGTIERPLAGRHLPAQGEYGGHGLWIANQLCDLVQIRSFADGSAVRLHKRIDGPHP